jgi:hypothetical protein
LAVKIVLFLSLQGDTAKTESHSAKIPDKNCKVESMESPTWESYFTKKTISDTSVWKHLERKASCETYTCMVLQFRINVLPPVQFRTYK